MINFLGRYYTCICVELLIGMLGSPVNLTFGLGAILISGIYIPIIMAGRVLCYTNDFNGCFHLNITLVGITTTLISAGGGYLFALKLLL